MRRPSLWSAVAFLAVFAPLAVYIRSLPDIYESTATILVERQQIPVELVRPTVTGNLEVRLATIRQQVLSRSELDRKIAHLNPYAELRGREPMEQVIERMRRDLEIEMAWDRGENAAAKVTVSYRGRDAQKVALVANSIASSVIEGNLEIRERLSAGTAKFFRHQVEEVSERLTRMEENLPLLKSGRERALREYETAKETHQWLAVRLREAALAEAMEQRQKGEQFRVIEPALPAKEPIAPPRARYYATALAFAALVAIVVAAALQPSPASSPRHHQRTRPGTSFHRISTRSDAGRPDEPRARLPRHPS